MVWSRRRRSRCWRSRCADAAAAGARRLAPRQPPSRRARSASAILHIRRDHVIADMLRGLGADGARGRARPSTRRAAPTPRAPRTATAMDDHATRTTITMTSTATTQRSVRDSRLECGHVSTAPSLRRPDARAAADLAVAGLPVGGYAYSHGLECADRDGQRERRRDARRLDRRCARARRRGAAMRCFLRRRPGVRWRDAATMAGARASAPSWRPRSRPRARAAAARRWRRARRSSLATLRGPGRTPRAGAARAARRARGCLPDCRRHRVAAVHRPCRCVERAPALSPQAFAANLVSAAVRLIPLGQTDGPARARASSMPVIAAPAAPRRWPHPRRSRQRHHRRRHRLHAARNPVYAGCSAS